MKLRSYSILAIALLCSLFSFAQEEVVLFDQLIGRFDYVAFGNTLNRGENGSGLPCEIDTESSAEYAIEDDQVFEAAYLYWSGSGGGDFDVTLNEIDITPERTFSYTLPANDSIDRKYFGAYRNITDIVGSTGNGTYTMKNLDVSDVIDPLYCNNATNYAGWAVVVVFLDEDLPVNQVSIFDGFESISGANPMATIELTDLQVIDNADSKVGFIAWEGDRNIANGETLTFNGTPLINNLNPPDNAFNGTNSFTNSTELFNMDIDVYNIENLIQPGDETAVIELTSQQDLIIVNNVTTVLNIRIPDATVVTDNVTEVDTCGDREITVDYTVSNFDGIDRLPPVDVGFFADNILMETVTTTGFIFETESQSGTVTFTVPDQVPADFLLRTIVDPFDDYNEISEDNNEVNQPYHLLVFPEIVGLTNQETCDVVGEEFFDLTLSTQFIDSVNTITYHLTEVDAQNELNAIAETTNFENPDNPQTIWIRVANPDCFVIDSFMVEVLICPLPDATVEFTGEIFACRRRDLVIDYTINNTEGTDLLPAGTEVVFFVDATIIAQTQTQGDIPIGGTEAGSLTITLAEDTPNTFLISAIVDDNGFGIGAVEELDETNNTSEILTEFKTIPDINPLPTLLECDEGFNMARFNLRDDLDDLIQANSSGTVNYFETEEDAITNQNEIADPEQYQNTSDPQTIYIRLENEICFTTSSVQLTTENCPPDIPEGISPNGDSLNDVFKIEGLINVFTDFKLQVFSREGNIIFEGRNEDGLWDAIPNTGLLNPGSIVPVGTYYYVLELNDSNFPEPILGWVYVNY